MRLVLAAARSRDFAPKRFSSGLVSTSAQAVRIGDPVGDDGPDFDSRGDLVAAVVSYGKSAIAVGAATDVFDDPSSSHNWEGFALGDPAFTVGTGILWGLDRNGDGTPDYVVAILNDGSGVVAGVTNGDGSVFLCEASPSWDSATNGYFVAFAASCIAKPAHIAAQAFMVYETPTTISQDITAWTPAASPPQPPPPPVQPGYWMVSSTGDVYAFGHARNFGSAHTNAVSHIEPTPSHGGYWIVNRAGQVFAFGNAHNYGDAPALPAGETVSSLSATPTGHGYWLFTNRGRVLRYGDASFYGDMSAVRLNGPVVGSVATPTGHGYYMVGSDGGVFGFGDAKFHGSMGAKHLNKPVIGLVPTADNRGYWLVASDGGIFGFGDAPFRGSTGNIHLNRPIIGMVRYGNGYLMVASDGGIFAYSNQPFYGSLGNRVLPAPITGVAT